MMCAPVSVQTEQGIAAAQPPGRNLCASPNTCAPSRIRRRLMIVNDGRARRSGGPPLSRGPFANRHWRLYPVWGAANFPKMLLRYALISVEGPKKPHRVNIGLFLFFRPNIIRDEKWGILP